MSINFNVGTSIRSDVPLIPNFRITTNGNGVYINRTAANPYQVYRGMGQGGNLLLNNNHSMIAPAQNLSDREEKLRRFEQLRELAQKRNYTVDDIRRADNRGPERTGSVEADNSNVTVTPVAYQSVEERPLPPSPNDKMYSEENLASNSAVSPVVKKEMKPNPVAPAPQIQDAPVPAQTTTNQQPVQTKPEEKKVNDIEIKKGDTLSAIAKKMGLGAGGVEMLKESIEGCKDVNKIYIGQKIDMNKLQAMREAKAAAQKPEVSQNRGMEM